MRAAIALQTTKVSREGGPGRAPGAGAEIPLQPMFQTIMEQDETLQPMEAHGTIEIHAQPMEETNTGAGGCLRGRCETP